VRIELLTGQNELRSGMNVDMTFLGDELPNAVVVPTVAIVTQNGESGVLVPDDRGNPIFQAVTLGNAVGNQTQVLEGVKPGDRVFVDIPENSEWGKPQDQQGES
ncbi:MAG TPA: hypothetical protein V6C88_12200, partial [Chroococcidiopsis sp.]